MGNSTAATEIFLWYFLPTVVTVTPLGLRTNAWVIYLLLRKPGICSTSEIFTLNLAVIDMLFCITVVGECINLWFNQSMEATSFLAWGLNQGGGPLFLCFLSLDSYVAVCHPLFFLRLKDPKLRLSLCLMGSAITAACCLLVKVSAGYKWNVILAIISFSTVVITTCSTLILKSLRQSGPSRKEVHPVKKRAFKIVLSALVIINVHYLPPIGEYLLRQLGPTSFKPYSVVTCVAYWILSMSSFVQPLTFLIRTKQLPKIS